MLTSVAVSPDGGAVLAASAGGDAWLWDSTSGTPRLRLPHPGPVWDAQFDHSGSRIVSACEDGVARVWDATEGRLLQEFRGHVGGVRSASFSPDGSLALTTSEHSDDASVLTWDPASGALRGEFRAPGVRPIRACFTPDGRRVVVGRWDDLMLVLDARRLTRLMSSLVPPFAPGEQVVDVAVSPDGALLASASMDRSLRTWDASTGALLVEYKCDEMLAALCFDSSGRWIVSARWDGLLRRWPADPLAEARARAPRALTPAERAEAGLDLAPVVSR